MLYGGGAYRRRSDNAEIIGSCPGTEVTCFQTAQNRGESVPGWDEPSESDATGALELYARQNAWNNSAPRGKDVGANQPLDDRIANGVTLKEGPALIATSCGNMDAFIRGSDNHIYHRTVSNDVWSNTYTDRGTAGVATTFDSDPTATLLPNGNKVIAARKGNAIYVKRYTSGTWQSWTALTALPNTTACSGPALAANATEARLLVVGCDGKLYQNKAATGGTFSTWSFIANGPGGNAFAGNPALVALGNTWELFTNSSTKDGYQMSDLGSGWGTWFKRPWRITGSSSPVAAGSTFGGSNLQVLYRSTSTPYSRVMWVQRIGTSGWSTPIAIGGSYATIAANMCSVIRTDLIGLMYDGGGAQRGLWHRTWFNP
jgi:hypothetical protein